VVISDRYIDSSLAYQGAGRTLDSDDVAWLSNWATDGLKPDLTVLLDIDPRVGLDRVSGRGKGHDRLESEAISFHDRVRHAFLDLAHAEPKRYLVLDATLPAEDLARLVAARVTDLLGPTADEDAEGDEGTGGDAAEAPEPPNFRSMTAAARAEAEVV
jgi:dTMP kinase